jgi:hypothetical protein
VCSALLLLVAAASSAAAAAAVPPQQAQAKGDAPGCQMVYLLVLLLPLHYLVRQQGQHLQVSALPPAEHSTMHSTGQVSICQQLRIDVRCSGAMG